MKKEVSYELSKRAPKRIDSWFEFDICFCGNPDGCEKKSTCVRCMNDEQIKRAKGMLLSYAMFHKAGEECQHYMRRENGKATRIH